MITLDQARALEPGDLVKHDDVADALQVKSSSYLGEGDIIVRLRREDGQPLKVTSFTEADLNRVSIVSSIGAGKAAKEPEPSRVTAVSTKAYALVDYPASDGVVIGSLPAGMEVEVISQTKDGEWLMVLCNCSAVWIEADKVNVTGYLDTISVFPTPEKEKSTKKVAKSVVEK